MVRAVLGGRNVYEEVTDGGRGLRFNMNRQTRKNVRTLLVKSADDADRLVNECFPPFSPPGQYPIPGYLFYVDDLSIVPFGKGKSISGDITTFDHYLATITYSPLPYAADSESGQHPILDMLERNWDFGGEYQTVPGTRMFWEGEDKPVADESVSGVIQINHIVHSFTRHHLHLAQVPFASIRFNTGRVNKTDFPANHPVFPGVKAETLKFMGAQVSYRFASDGTQDYRVAFNWHERVATYDTSTDPEDENDSSNNPQGNSKPLTWQHLYDSSKNEWRRIYHDKDHKKPLHATATIRQIESLLL